jgi:hypothetical protein
LPVAIKPVQLPQEKNGEQPAHSFSFDADLPAVVLAAQLSAQHGLTVNSITMSENNTHKNFIRQMYMIC